MMACRLLITEEDGQKLAATFTFAGGRVVGKAESGHEETTKSVLGCSHIIDGGKRQVTSSKQPKVWFDSLPTTYNGSYLRAQLVK